MAEGRRIRTAEEPLDGRYWGEWELYLVGSGFEHVAEEDLRRFTGMVAESNRFGKLRMKEIHRDARRAKIRLTPGREGLRAGNDIEAGQRVGYLACDVYGEREHPGGSLRYRNRLDRIGNIFLSAQFLPSPSAGYDDSGIVSNLWFARTSHVHPIR